MKRFGQFWMRHFQFASRVHQRANQRKYGQQSVGETAWDFEMLYEAVV